MILEFAQKLFSTQNLLPFNRFERIVNLSDQRLFHPATIFPGLPAPTSKRLENPLNSLAIHERFHFLQPSVTSVAAPGIASQTFPALAGCCLAERRFAHRVEMQISAYFQQITLSLYYGALKSALKQMPDQLMPPIKVDRVRGLELMHPLGKISLGRRRHQLEMIHHEDVTVHFYPVALCPFGQVVEKLGPISVIPENLFLSISTRNDVVHRSGELNPCGP
jgi:hypothetical protein